jgi:hypothetical protein
MEASPAHSLDELREALRQRGYLDRGLDRLILQGAGSRFAWLLGSLKAGVIAGVLLGLLFLCVLLLVEKPTLNSPLEVALLGIYLTILSTSLTMLVELVAALLARTLARLIPKLGPDPSRLAWGVGSLVALLFTIYFSAWWKGREESGWALGSHLGVLGFIVMVSLAIGRMTSTTALLSLLRPGVVLSRPQRAGRRTLGLLVLILFVGLALAIPRGRGRSPDLAGTPAPYTPAARDGRLLWIGFDGLGSKLLGALQAAGHMRGLQEIERRGCGVHLDRLSGEPPAVWVSAATGFSSSHHGIPGAESAVFPGIRTPLGSSNWSAPLVKAARVLNPWLPRVGEIPVSGLHRKDKMVWEILGEKGVPSFVVNWWTTWPALQGPGVRISERTFLRLQVGGSPDRETFPPEEMKALQKDSPARWRSGHAAALGTQPGEELGVAMDTFHLGLASRAWIDRRWPLVTVYLNGSDILAEAPFSNPDSRAQRLVRDKSLVDHLEWLDGQVSEMATAAAENDFILIQGDPARTRPSQSDSGFAILIGPGIAKGKSLRGSLMDLAPTVLWLSGFPLSREMPGRPWVQCLSPGASLSWATPSSIPRFGARELRPERESDFDPAVLERLRSLGYIR